MARHLRREGYVVGRKRVVTASSEAAASYTTTRGTTVFNDDKSWKAIRTRGGMPQVVQTGTWGGAAALAQLTKHNARGRCIRCRIEKVFGTCKRSYGLRRMRWLGLTKAGLQARLTAIAYNLRRTVTLLHAAA